MAATSVKGLFSSFMLTELFKGMALTGRHFLSRKITVQFPEEKTPLSPRFRGRAVRGWPFYLDCFEVWRGALVTAGCDGRQADQLAALLAGRDLLLHDILPDSDSQAIELERLAPLLADTTAADREDGDAGHQPPHGAPVPPERRERRHREHQNRVLVVIHVVAVAVEGKARAQRQRQREQPVADAATTQPRGLRIALR